MVYVDVLMHYPASHFADAVPLHWRRLMWCHMYGDTLTELHAMARKIGLKRSWFQDHDRFPHYDLTGRMRERALNAGAQEKEVDGHDLARWDRG